MIKLVAMSRYIARIACSYLFLLIISYYLFVLVHSEIVVNNFVQGVFVYLFPGLFAMGLAIAFKFERIGSLLTISTVLLYNLYIQTSQPMARGTDYFLFLIPAAVFLIDSLIDHEKFYQKLI